MKSRGKRLFKRLFKMARIPFLIGIGLFIGLIIGAESNQGRQVVVANDGRFADELAYNTEQRVEQQIQEHMVEEVVVPPIPPIPPIPPVPPIPDFPEMPAFPESPDFPDFHTNVHIERGPSFWDVLNGIGTILASLILIGMGSKILIQRWRQPQEKPPDSVGA